MADKDLRALGKKIKVIICDLDHTLLDSQKQISHANLTAIKKAQRNGIFVTISSGRIFTMLKTYQKDLAIDGPLITTNGAAIVDSRDNKLLWSRPVDRSTSLRILDFAREKHYDYSALTGEACYFSPNSVRIRKFHQYNHIALAQGSPPIPLTYLNGDNRVVEGEIFKILIDERNPGELFEASAFLSTIEGINFTNSEQGLLDIMTANVDKGMGVIQLRRILGVKKEEICVFGDYVNDLPMFREAGFNIAMENAHDTLKEQAHYVTNHHDEDGVAKAIYKYILQ